MKKRFHHGSLSSPRIKILLKILRVFGKNGATTMELSKLCASTRPSSDVAEARANGIRIQTKYEGRTDDGRKIYRYTLLKN